MNRIRVSEKALAHLSKGLYRSPASAVRELVSNAWDACATRVDITSSFPAFNLIVVQDNGRGFNQSEFLRLMNGGIGNSNKRASTQDDEAAPCFDRPTIGRLGIGLLAIAQICSKFRVESRNRLGETFAAELRIEDALRRRLDANDPTIVSEETTGDGVRESVTVGSWTFITPGAFEEGWTGTRIVVDEPLASFTESFISTLRPPAKDVDEQEEEMADRVDRPPFPTPEEMQSATPPLRWRDAVEISKKVESVLMRGDYWRFLWELSATCPLTYFDDDAVPNAAIKRDQARLRRYKFSVAVDNRVLHKPVLLTESKHGFSVRTFEKSIRISSTRSLKFHGYLAVQEGAQLRPAELRGVMVRIKDVGVGYYDPSLLDWQVNQGPRSRWITGEVFVDEGLEDAMNVDRDSFNRYHPEFKLLQHYLHEELKRSMSVSYKKILERSEQSSGERFESRKETIESVLSAASGRKVSVTKRPVARHGEKVNIVVRQQEGYAVRIDAAQTLDTVKAKRELAAAILALFDVCVAVRRDSEERRASFQEGLLALLRRWR